MVLEIQGLSGVTLADIFLRRLFQPEVFQLSTLREVLQKLGANASEADLLSLSSEGLKKEVVLAVQSEVKHLATYLMFTFVMYE